MTSDTLYGSLRFRPDSALAIARTTVRRTEQFQARDGASIGLVLGGVAVLGLAVVVAFVANGGPQVFSDQ